MEALYNGTKFVLTGYSIHSLLNPKTAWPLGATKLNKACNLTTCSGIRQSLVAHNSFFQPFSSPPVKSSSSWPREMSAQCLMSIKLHFNNLPTSFSRRKIVQSSYQAYNNIPPDKHWKEI